MNNPTYPRHAVPALIERLRAMPAVVLTGARQTGKSTLAAELVPGKRRYLTLDDLEVLDAARRDPEALVGGSAPVTLDEVQRAPDLLLAVKRSIDRQRQPGRFCSRARRTCCSCAASPNPWPAGPVILTLWPMSRREQQGRGRCGLWEALVDADDAEWLDHIAADDPEPEDWRALASRGGFPTPAVHMRRAADRAVWFEGYVRTYLERDLQALSSIAALPDFRRLMRAAALRLGQLVNQTGLARDLSLAQPTVHRYLNLLETSYLLVRLPAYAVNRTKRLIKSPKLYWGDVGLALHLAGHAEPSGAHLENLVLHDLLVWRDGRADRAEILYWRTTTGEEVDFVIEAGGRVLPIEIKATGRPRLSDTAAPASLPTRVRQRSPRGAPAAYRLDARVAGARRPRRALVASLLSDCGAAGSGSCRAPRDP